MAHRANAAAKAVGYIRVSTEEQAANGYGLEVQSSAIRSFVQSQGYELVDIISDPAVSGAKAPKDRPGFRRVMDLAEAHAFSILVVWKFDRLARSLLYSVTTVNELHERHGVVLRSVTEPIDTATPMGAMIFAILASFAAEERRVITSRTLAGKKQKAMRGGFAGGPAPLGYVPDLRGGLDDRCAGVSNHPAHRTTSSAGALASHDCEHSELRGLCLEAWRQISSEHHPVHTRQSQVSRLDRVLLSPRRGDALP